MRRTVLAVFVMVVVCSFSALGQSVVEGESSMKFGAASADLSLMIDSRAKTSQDVMLEILDTSGKVRASVTSKVVLDQGRHSYKFAIPTTDLETYESSDLPWYRLHYRVGDASGMISFSEIMRDDF